MWFGEGKLGLRVDLLVTQYVCVYIVDIYVYMFIYWILIVKMCSSSTHIISYVTLVKH